MTENKQQEERTNSSAKSKSKTFKNVWTDEKRAEHGRKIKAALAARKQAEGK